MGEAARPVPQALGPAIGIRSGCLGHRTSLFAIDGKLGRRRALKAIVRTNCANELHLDACVLQTFAILWPDRHCALDGLPVHVQGDPLAAAFVELDID